MEQPRFMMPRLLANVYSHTLGAVFWDKETFGKMAAKAYKNIRRVNLK